MRTERTARLREHLGMTGDSPLERYAAWGGASRPSSSAARKFRKNMVQRFVDHGRSPPVLLNTPPAYVLSYATPRRDEAS